MSVRGVSVEVCDSTNSSVLGLGDEKVEDAGLDETPDTENNVRLPGDIFKSNGDTELGGKESY